MTHKTDSCPDCEGVGFKTNADKVVEEKVCPTCVGYGRVAVWPRRAEPRWKECEACHGTGKDTNG